MPSGAVWELCKCGQGSTGQCMLYALRSMGAIVERGEVTVGNDFCIYLSAKWHCTLISLQHINFWKKRSYSLETGTHSKQMHKTRFFHAFSRSFSVGGTNLLSVYTCICCLNKHLLVQQLGLGGWWHFHLQNTIWENTLCMKVAGRGRRVVFDLLKKYFLLNYCYNFFYHST